MKYKDYTVEDFVQDKYFREWAESGNPEADEFWNRWISENPEKISAVNEASSIIRNMKFREHHLNPGEKNLLWENIRRETRKSDLSRQNDIQIRYMKPARFRGGSDRDRRVVWGSASVATAVAAAALLFIALSAVWLMTSYAPAAQITHSTDFGEIREIRLPDGTLVIVNANSAITLAGEWGPDRDREVWLQGEAFFDVTHMENRESFIVHANGVGARVLGTEFSVYNRGGRSAFELASGRIMLESDSSVPFAGADGTIIMEPGDRVMFEDSGSEPLRMRVNTQDVGAWKDNLLIFRRTSLADISTLLKTNYDLDVIFTDQAVAGQYFTGTVPADNLGVLFESLEKTFDLGIVRSNRTVIIQKD